MLKRITAACAAACAFAATPASASFIANFHENLNSGNNSLFIFGEENTAGTITGNDGFSQNFVIDSTGVYTLSLGASGREMTQSGVTNNLSLLVDSDGPISGLALNRGPATTDMTTLLDIDGLSSDYLVLSTPGAFGDGSQMSVTAVEDNTVVTITSKLAIGGNPANTPFQVTLQAGETAYFESGTGADISGTRVTADKNVAVFGGAECTQVPVGVVACDHLIAQQFGIENFDTEFLIAENFGGGADGDMVRVIASVDNTEVFVNGVSQGFIDAGEVMTLDGVDQGFLTSSEPVMVGQLIRGEGGTRTLGDPAFALIPSVDQLLDAYVFATPVGGDSFSQNFLNIAIEQSIASSLLLNGVAVDTSGFSLINGVLFGNIAIGLGVGTISASDVFLATIAGFSSFDSYFSVIASGFSPGVSPPPPPPDVSEVPLPAGAWLLLTGLGAMGWAGRRKKAA